jgi:hypothetical protein
MEDDSDSKRLVRYLIENGLNVDDVPGTLVQLGVIEMLRPGGGPPSQP